MNTCSRIQNLANNLEIENSHNKGHVKISEFTVAISLTCLCNVTLTRTFQATEILIEPHVHQLLLSNCRTHAFSVLCIFSSPEPLGSKGELIGWP